LQRETGVILSTRKRGFDLAANGAAKLWAKEVGRLGTAYYVKIGRTRFQVPSAEHFGTFDDAARYRVYYIINPPAHIVLSAERL